jgi:hypothetical protein
MARENELGAAVLPRPAVFLSHRFATRAATFTVHTYTTEWPRGGMARTVQPAASKKSSGIARGAIFTRCSGLERKDRTEGNEGQSKPELPLILSHLEAFTMFLVKCSPGRGLTSNGRATMLSPRRIWRAYPDYPSGPLRVVGSRYDATADRLSHARGGPAANVRCPAFSVWRRAAVDQTNSTAVRHG